MRPHNMTSKRATCTAAFVCCLICVAVIVQCDANESLWPFDIAVDGEIVNNNHNIEHSEKFFAECVRPVQMCVLDKTDFSAPLVQWQLISGMSFSPLGSESGSTFESCCLCDLAARCFDKSGEYIGDTVAERIPMHAGVMLQWCVVLRDHYAEIVENTDGSLISCPDLLETSQTLTPTEVDEFYGVAVTTMPAPKAAQQPSKTPGPTPAVTPETLPAGSLPVANDGEEEAVGLVGGGSVTIEEDTCRGNLEEADCDDAAGCMWMDDECASIDQQCQTLRGKSACGKVDVCAWTDGKCRENEEASEKQNESCDNLQENDCDDAEGCMWMDDECVDIDQYCQTLRSKGE